MTEALREVAESLNKKISPECEHFPSGRKRRHVGESDDSGDDRARDSNSSSWEDQESSDDAKLKIVEPKRRKIRKKRAGDKSPSRRLPNEVVIPEDVLSECSKLLAMDQKLDAKAKSINWGTKQVKMVLRAIVQSEEMMNMLRNAGLATGEKKPQQQPKMTRAMTKKVVEAGGDVVPFMMAPATPVKPVDKNIMSLLTEDLREEDNTGEDPEYNPEFDKLNFSDDDDSVFTSEQGSEVGTPQTMNTDSRMSNLSGVVTPSSSGQHRPTPEQFKRPFRSLGVDRLAASRILDFDNPDPHPGYSTRSRHPMTDTLIEDIEQTFIPPDITPDMYEVTCENDDYSEFLKELYGSTFVDTNTSNIEDLEDVEDPEFVYCPDEADKQTTDPEELRNDKATKITKKEVAELIAELQECANQAKDDASKKKIVKRKKTPLPGDAIYEAVKEHLENDMIKEIAESQTVEDGVDAVVEPPPNISEEERSEIGRQMQQHIQLVTQMSLLSSHNPAWRGVRSQCDQMMSQIVSTSLSTPNNLAGQSNLLTSLAVIRDWDELGSDPTVISKNKNSKKHKKRFANFNISDKLFTFMSKQSVFYYPLLLPTSALATDDPRIVWTNSEDHLLALAMRAAVPYAKKPGLMELSFALQARHMRAKSAIQIRTRMKNLKIREDENPVLMFIKSGETKPLAVEHTWGEVGNGTRTLMETVMAGARTDFPAIWLKKILDIGSKRNSSQSVLIEISPKPEPTTFVNTPLNSSIQIVTLPKQMLNDSNNQIIIVNNTSSSAGLGATEMPKNCSSLANYNNTPIPLPRPIMCVDGTNATPPCTSDSDTPDHVPPITTLAAGSKSLQQSVLHTNSPLLKSPLKRAPQSAHQFHKSPLKAASDRILKKYATVSPSKKSSGYFSPHKRALRELRKKPLSVSPSQTLTPSRRLVPLAPRRAETPPSVDLPVPGLSPRSPCLPSPSQDETDAGAEVDTPTILARRKTRHQKETELTLSLVGHVETPEEKDARDARESQEMFQEITRVVADSQDLQTKFATIMGQASTAGTISTYQALNDLLTGHPLVQEMLLDLLSESQAATLGTEVYWQHHQRQNMKKFIYKLGVAYRHQPAYHARVIRELDTLCSDPSLTPDMLKGVAVKLFKHNQYLLDQFLVLVPGVEPPESMLPSPEVLQYPDDSDHSWGSDEARQETIVVQRSPES